MYERINVRGMIMGGLFTFFAAVTAASEDRSIGKVIVLSVIGLGLLAYNLIAPRRSTEKG